VKYAQQRNDYRNERDLLEDCIELKQYLGEDIGTEQAAIADSFEAEAEKKGQRSSMIRASVLSSAVDRCAEFVDEQRVAKWKRAVRDANRTTHTVYSQITHEMRGVSAGTTRAETRAAPATRDLHSAQCSAAP
jgi:hypothetical protein